MSFPKLFPTVPFLILSFLFVNLSFPPSTNALDLLALPSPQKDPANICRRSKPSAICDPQAYLSQSDADTIDGLINFIQAGEKGFKKPPCSRSDPTPVGAELAVAIVHGLPPDITGNTKETRAFHYAKALHDRWGVGNPTCQNGIVIVFAVKDRAMGFSIGEGVNRIFTDAMLPTVMSAMKPMLRKEEYGKAIIQGVADVGNVLGGVQLRKSNDSGPDHGFFFWILAAIGGFFAISQLSAVRRRRRYNRCKDILKKIDQDRVRASNNNYVITSCPICLEDFDNGNSAGAGASEAKEQVSTGTEESNAVPLVTAQERSQTMGSSNPSNSAAARNNASTQLTSLPCGHKFHESCILTWFRGNRQANTQCPICRQPIDSSQPVESRTNNGAPSGWEVYDPEYAFRMRRTRHYYPDYLTWTMMNDWSRDRYNSRARMATSAAFARVDPTVIAMAARASGRSGSSFSYGGGSSSRGGGGGGSW